MYTLPSRDIVLLYYVQNLWEWGGWCGTSLIYPHLYLYCGPGAEGCVGAVSLILKCFNNSTFF